MSGLSIQARKCIEQSVGMPFEDILRMSPEEELEHVQKKTGRPVTYSKKLIGSIMGRGNPYIAVGKITMPEDMERRLKAIR